MASKLSCDPMRITKKFASRLAVPIGKKLPFSKDESEVNAVESEEFELKLELLEYLFGLSLTSVITENHISQLKKLQEKQLQKLLERQELEMKQLLSGYSGKLCSITESK